MSLIPMPVRAQLLVAGGLSVAVMGLIDSVYSKCGRNPLAVAHGWLHNLGYASKYCVWRTR